MLGTVCLKLCVKPDRASVCVCVWESFEKDVCARGEGHREIVHAGQSVPSVKSVCACVSVCVSKCVIFSKACSVGMRTAVAGSDV